jgi:cobaltochelatase CobN
MASLDPVKLPYITQQIWSLVTQNNLDRDLKVDRCPEAEAFDAFLQEIDGYLCELGDAQIRDGPARLRRAAAGASSGSVSSRR